MAPLKGELSAKLTEGFRAECANSAYGRGFSFRKAKPLSLGCAEPAPLSGEPSTQLPRAALSSNAPLPPLRGGPPYELCYSCHRQLYSIRFAARRTAPWGKVKGAFPSFFSKKFACSTIDSHCQLSIVNCQFFPSSAFFRYHPALLGAWGYLKATAAWAYQSILVSSLTYRQPTPYSWVPRQRF